jgi:hypothetical protein
VAVVGLKSWPLKCVIVALKSLLLFEMFVPVRQLLNSEHSREIARMIRPYALTDFLTAIPDAIGNFLKEVTSWDYSIFWAIIEIFWDSYIAHSVFWKPQPDFDCFSKASFLAFLMSFMPRWAMSFFSPEFPSPFRALLLAAFTFSTFLLIHMAKAFPNRDFRLNGVIEDFIAFGMGLNTGWFFFTAYPLIQEAALVKVVISLVLATANGWIQVVFRMLFGGVETYIFPDSHIKSVAYSLFFPWLFWLMLTESGEWVAVWASAIILGVFFVVSINENRKAHPLAPFPVTEQVPRQRAPCWQ